MASEQDLADYQAYLNGTYQPPNGIALPAAAPKVEASAQDLADYQSYLNGTYEPLKSTTTQAPQSGALLASNTLMAPLQGASFNLGDEAVAGAQTAIEGTTNVLGDYLVNPIRGLAGYDPITWDRGAGYDKNLESVRSDYNQYKVEHPKEALASELVGALAMPVSGAVQAFKGAEGVQALSKLPVFEGIAKAAINSPTAAKIAKGALVGGTQAGLYGFGGGEGDLQDRLESGADMAKWGAAIGGAVPLVGETIKKGSSWIADKGLAGQKSAVGISAAMEKASAKKPLGKYTLEQTGQTPLSESFDRVKEMGVFKGGLDVAPDKLYQKIADKADEVHSNLISTLKLADETLEAPPKINLRTLAERIEDTFSLQQRVDATKHLNKQIKNFESQFDGSLASLEKIKRDLYKTSYGASGTGSTKIQVDRLIANRIKTAIESTVDDLAAKGKLDSSYAGRIRSLNKDLGALISLEDPALGQLSRYTTGDLAKGVLGKIRTSGGAGVPILGGLYTGNPMLGLAGGALMLAKDTPSAWYALNKAVSGVGGLGSAIGGGISNLPSATLGPILDSFSQPSEDQKSSTGIGEMYNSAVSIPDQAELLPEYETTVADALDRLPELQPKIETKNSKSQPSVSSPLKDIAYNLNASQPKDIKRFILQQPKLIQAMIKQESGGKIDARSSAGAIGLMQLMPATARELGVNPLDPMENVAGGTRYIKQMFEQFDSPYLAIAAYNAGPGNVQKAIRKAGTEDWTQVRRFLPKETQNYVPSVLRNLANLRTA